MDDFTKHKLKFSLSGLQRSEAGGAGPTEQTCLLTQRREAERVGLLAEGDVAENLTKETKEKLKKMFTPSKPNEEITTLDQSTNRPEWTAAKAEAEPEAVQVRQNIPTERPSKESSEEGDEWTRRSRRRRKRGPAGRNLRRRTGPRGSRGPGR